MAVGRNSSTSQPCCLQIRPLFCKQTKKGAGAAEEAGTEQDQQNVSSFHEVINAAQESCRAKC